jgi:quercetin dioxygenase-like cupin family protein
VTAVEVEKGESHGSFRSFHHDRDARRRWRDEHWIGKPGRVAAPRPCAENMSIQMLGNTELVAAPGQTLVLVRAIFGPGGGIGPHTHPGTLAISVESGAFGFTGAEDQMHGEMMKMRPGEQGAPVAAEPMTPGEEVVLSPGDWIVETGMVHSARAVGDVPAIVVFSGLAEAGQPLTTCVE